MQTNQDNLQHVSRLTEFDVQLFKAGKHYKIYEKLGSHIMEVDGTSGTYFAVWAPNASAIFVKGDFNGWKAGQYAMKARWDGSGIWETFIPGIGHGQIYKYHIDCHDGRSFEKGDPYARRWEHPPSTASIIWDMRYEWKDSRWMNKRKKQAGQPQPMSVYEVHLGSWKRRMEEEKRSLTYRELATELVDYVKDMGFTHVELMPIMEYPYAPSWGYQLTGYYAASSRFGTPEELMLLIDAFHQADIGVLLDWVPSHFPSDGHGLAYFDGTHLYEHEDPRKGYHPDWKSYIFNYGRYEVRSFLISNAIFWLEQYHADGLRVDAVASMLYLDYSREEGQWIPNKYGGNENLEAISFLREANEAVKTFFPDALTIAEESTAFAGVSRPVADGGLGFDQKWMMGWMHDMLKYMRFDPFFRKHHQNELTFSLVYAFTENFMLPLSHDEVVHGKGPLIDRMPGNEEQRFANLRMLYGFMYTHPGTQLLFMGGEFGQTREWNFAGQLEWWLLQYDYHQGMQSWVRDLNQLLRQQPSLYQRQFEPEGFEWIAYDDHDNSVIVFLRHGKPRQPSLLVVCHFTPVAREGYRIGLPKRGSWQLLINSDAKQYGGAAGEVFAELKPEKKEKHDRKYSTLLQLPPLSVLVYEPVKRVKKKG
ncbi:MAG: 1,4-alpha-glucan branching protein GlgB [Bacteroidota bacterium]